MDDYLFASGAIKSLEVKLLDKNKIFRLTYAKKEAFVKTLYDMGYGTTDESIDKIIESEMEKVKKSLLFYTPNEVLTKLFFIAGDAQNIKLLLKNQKYHIFENDQLTFTNGGINSEELFKFFTNEIKEVKEPYINEFIKKLLVESKNINSAKDLSNYIDRECYTFALKNASSNKIVIKYFKNQIDTSNLISFFRCLNLKWDINEFVKLFISGGNISLTEFKNNYNLDYHKQNFRWLKNYYDEKLLKPVLDYLEDNSLNRLEIALTNVSLNIMSNFKNEAGSIGPMIYYYLEKVAEAKNIRIVYSSENVSLNDLITY